MKRYFLMCFILLLLLLPTACAKKVSAVKTPPFAKIGLYLPPFDDYFSDYDELAKKGVKDIQKEYPVEIKILKADKAVYESAYADTLAKDNDIVVFMSFPLNEAFSQLTVKYPKKYFIGIESYIDGQYYEETQNASGIFAKDEQGGFLAGMLAGMLTTDRAFPGMNKEKKIAFIGAVQSPWLNRDLGGYQQGAWYIDPKIEITEKWGPDNNPLIFNNPQWAYKEAKRLYLEKGVDIIFAVGGKTAEGVLKAANETGKYAISMGGSKGYLAPGHVLAGINRNIDVMIYKELKNYLDQKKDKDKKVIKEIKFHSGPYKYGIPEGVIDISDLVGMDEESKWLNEGKISQKDFAAIKGMKEKIPDQVIEKIADTKEKITKGEIEIREASGPVMPIK